jgi:cytochrome P450
VTTGFTFDRFSDGDLDSPVFAQLREGRPVFYAEEFGVWVASRYDDVRRVLMDPTRFSSAFGIRTPSVPAPGVADILATGHPEVAALLNEDPPTHRRTRDLVSRTFTARRIAGLEPAVAALVTELLDPIVARGRADLVADFAVPLPLQVICALIGLPPGDAPRVGEWVRQVAVLTSYASGAQEQRAAAYESVDFERYLAAAVTDRRLRPRDDLLTDLTRVRADGVPPLSDLELISLLISLVTAGHETTANLVAGALVQLLHRPPLWAAIGADPQLLTAVVEETLRFDPPVQGVFRRAVFDVRIGDATIPAGAQVFALLGGANHDGSVFAAPEQFDPGRADADKHLAFGRGIHFCLGAALARMQAGCAVRMLRERLPGLRLAPGVEVPYVPDLLLRGPRRLPVLW